MRLCDLIVEPGVFADQYDSPFLRTGSNYRVVATVGSSLSPTL
jgi:hypothetical protein